MERRALQIILGVLSLVPLLGLFISWWEGPQFFFGEAGGVVPSALDNQFRYLAGSYVGGVTLSLWWAIPQIETRGVAMNIAAAAVVFGGLGRCVSMLNVGIPSDPSMIVGLGLELGVVPLLVLWQRRLARRALSAS